MFGLIEVLPILFAVAMFKLWLDDVNKPKPAPKKPDDELKKVIAEYLAQALSEP
ncbi:hypothetical protein [Leptolyngbya sp. PCC 6406]|uniref:hypothetical protein n=1 Tax=Leptolyngbya sp. PCC 6406 TaxID=1173264 RepID=UPI0002ACE9E6|nr:hypothetical protein [Leptolyngbya sp. PCC 6406]